MKAPHRHYDMTTRAAKAEATRDRVRRCAADLYFARPIDDFTLEEVAIAAETTVQTVLRAFGSRDQLMVEALDLLARQNLPGRPTPPGDAAQFIGAVFDIYETIGDLMIRRLGDQNRYPSTKADLDRGRASHRGWVRQVFATQLARRAGAARERMFHALAAATDVYTWQILRRDEGLDRPAAEAVVRDIVAGITRGETGDGKATVAELVRRRKSAA